MDHFLRALFLLGIQRKVLASTIVLLYSSKVGGLFSPPYIQPEYGDEQADAGRDG